MLLSDLSLAAMMKSGRLTVDPLAPGAMQPASIDVRIGDEFRLILPDRYDHIDPQADQPGLTAACKATPGEPFLLFPGEFALGCTLETITLDASLAGRLEGKSTLGRLGLMIHSTAGWIDPGFSGQVTLELSNAAKLPVKIWPGMKIGQLCVFRCSRPAGRPYGHPELGSHYQGQRGPVAARTRP